MNIPKAVNILGKKYKVIMEEPKDGDYGECNYRHTTIKVSPKQSADSQADTLLHEILHAISEELQYPLQEKQVRLTATALMSVMRANPALVAYLCLQQ